MLIVANICYATTGQTLVSPLDCTAILKYVEGLFYVKSSLN